MGPLTPEIFNTEINYIIAIIIGFFFGFILEAAGFSSSRKLAGLFYGYDFVVLRVFFTAGVTAMIGVALLGYTGLLDLDLIYVNPTFLWSAIVGGLIMGGGFIMGGYCPGTAVAGAAIGKIDGFVFMIGIMLGIFTFTEGYPAFEGLYNGFAWGDVRINELLHMSQGKFIFIMIGIAIIAFIVTTKIETKVVRKNNSEFRNTTFNKKVIAAGFVYAAIGILMFFTPSRKDSLYEKINDNKFTASLNTPAITAEELAFRLIDRDNKIMVVDVRSKDDYSKFSLPGAANIPFDELTGKASNDIIKKSYKKLVFCDYDGTNSIKAAALANIMGNTNTLVLKGGIDEFMKTFSNVTKPDSAKMTFSDRQNYLFRTTALQKLDELSKSLVKVQTPTAVKKNKGGC